MSNNQVTLDDITLNPQNYKNREQLAEEFGMARSTVCKRIKNIPHAGVRDRGLVWHIADVCTLRDARLQLEQPHSEPTMEANPDKMKLLHRRIHYQAEDAKQSALLKERKNAIASGELMPASKVEQVLATAFKAIALSLDTLPDALERDGMLDSFDVERTIALIDKMRTKLADDLADMK